MVEPKFKEPIRILSDLHLGHPASRIERVEQLRPLMGDVGTVIFNGDTWEELARPWRERSEAMLGELKAMCAEEGSEPVFLSGNHDPGWPGRGWAEIAGGKIIVTHGDALLFASSPWKREIMMDPGRIARLWDKHPHAEKEVEERLRVAREIARELHASEFPRSRCLLHRVWDAVIPPQRALRMIEAWCTQGRRAAEFCDHYFPQAEVMVIGHFHWPGSWRVDGRQIINTGTFASPNRAHWAELSEGLLRRGKVNEKGGECRVGKVLDVLRL